MTNPVYVGATVEISTEISNDVGELEDPTALTLDVTKPDGTTDSYSWAAETITRDGDGSFSKELTIDQSGKWSYTWQSTGIVRVSRGGFLVVPFHQKVKVHVSSGEDSLPNVNVKIFKSDSSFASSMVTDSSGEVNLELLPGVYVVEVSRGKTVAALTDITVEDSGDPQTFNITATVSSISDPSPEETVLLYGYIHGAAGQLLNNCRVVIETFARGLPNGTVQGGEAWEVYSVNGYWETRLVPRSLVQIRIPDLGLVKSFRCPSSGEVNFADVRPEVKTVESGLQADTEGRRSS